MPLPSMHFVQLSDKQLYRLTEYRRTADTATSKLFGMFTEQNAYVCAIYIDRKRYAMRYLELYIPYSITSTNQLVTQAQFNIRSVASHSGPASGPPKTLGSPVAPRCTVKREHQKLLSCDCFQELHLRESGVTPGYFANAADRQTYFNAARRSSEYFIITLE